jgi:imidazolonepropionase
VSPGVSITGAAQVLRPPEDGLAFMRHDRAGELSAEPGSVAFEGDRIAGFEPDPTAVWQIDAQGCAVIPGFVDCHTHLPFAGWRAEEYEMKVTGVPYEEIARAGGGIRASARALARASDDAILAQARALAAEMLAHGTTTFEGKSGYGLSVEAELRLLGLAGRLAEGVPQPTATTALLAHAVPDGYDADGWMEAVAAMVPEVARATRATALDIYVESIGFTNQHLRRMGELASAHGLDLRTHVEQFNSHRSIPVALEVGARSVDHLSCLHPDDIGPLAAADCAAVLLPGAEFMGNEHVPPARELVEAGALCVLATDANPGTSPIVSMPLVIGLAVRRYGWNVLEALLAATLNAAWVLRASTDTGSLEVGKRADILLLDGPLEHIPYRLGHNPVAIAFLGGEPVWVRPDCAWRVAG